MSIPFSYLVGTASQALEKKRQRQIEEQERASAQEMEALRRALMQAQITKLNAPPEPERPITLSPGQGLYDPVTGKPIAERPGDSGTTRPVTLSPGAALVDPMTGRVITERPGEPKEPKQPTQEERRAGGLYIVAEDAYRQLQQDFDTPTFKDWAAGKVPLGLGQGFVSSGQQLREQAGAQLYRAYLYTVSGATVNPDEALQAAKTFLPQLGDAPALVQRKLEAITTMMEAIRAVSGRAGPPQAPGTPTATPDPLRTAPTGRKFDRFLSP